METIGRMVVEGFDWGPAVTRVIFKPGDNFGKTAELNPTLFEAEEIKKNDKNSFSAKRSVTDAYYSDEPGNPDEKGDYICLTLQFGPEKGSPMYYDFSTGFNKWFDYHIKVKVKGEEYNFDNGDFFFSEIEDVDLSGEFKGSEGHNLRFASYKPKNASEENRRPLVIWLHGMGEGGNNPLIALYGNRVTALFGDEFQKTMGGAYVITPQTPTFWLQYKEDDKTSWVKNKGEDSIYLNDLKELIDKYANENYVDKKRIIVGGCSNGGFMTMDLILNYPDYFAAAYPICEAFYPKKLKKEQLLAIKDIPMWFVYAKNDMTVKPRIYEKPLLKELKNAGASNIKVSEFKDVHDTSGLFLKNGKPYKYFGHFSWIYFFNNECVEDGTSIWKWMSEVSK